MRSQQLTLANYSTDKISSRYLEMYDPMLAPWVDKEIVLLELGIYQGGSLKLWRDYFSKGKIVGIDIEPPPGLEHEERIRVFQGRQEDTHFLSQVATEVAPQKFDIIIDDASHLGALTKISFWHLFENHLKPGGLYVIEDWGTGFWSDWPDGQKFRPRSAICTKAFNVLQGRKLIRSAPFESHRFGMVGFVKELIDEQGAADLTRGALKGTPTRNSKFQSVTVMSSLVFIRKASDA